MITGCYATTYGMEQHRARVVTPPDIFFPEYLRKAGYYCTNNVKTDYNSTFPDKKIWDECSPAASYNSPGRKDGQPFFSVFNSQITHMSRMTSIHLEGRRDFAKEGLDPDSLQLPPHVPDIPEIRSDYAFHLEGANDIDRWIRIFLDDLKAKGLADNTIIFIFSDHGGCLPRGKGFAYETSFRVPFIVYLPDRWKHLSKTPAGQPVERLVSFVDFAPTVLSLAGVEIPDYMQGLPFLGTADHKEREYQIGYVGNQGQHFLSIRTISDGKMKYIRRFIPYKNDALLNDFQWQLPSNLYWDKLYFGGNTENDIERRPYEVCEAELLYDIENDPFELHNLAGDRKYAADLERLKNALKHHIVSSGDLGFVPRQMRFFAGKDRPFCDAARDIYDMDEIYRLAWMTSDVSAKDTDDLCSVLESGDDASRYWAIVNLSQLAVSGNLEEAPEELIAMLDYKNDVIAQEAAFAILHTDQWTKAVTYLEDHIEESLGTLEVLSFSPDIWNSRIPDSMIQKIESLASLDDGIKKNTVNARKILVNIGKIPAELLYGHEKDEAGLKTNRNRRPLAPKPY